VHIQYRTILQYKPFIGNLNLHKAFLGIMLKSAKKTFFTYYNCLIFVGYRGIAKFRNANYFCKLERRGYLRRGDKTPRDRGICGRGGIVGGGSELGGWGWGWG
jgi:hypothetical protein